MVIFFFWYGVQQYMDLCNYLHNSYTKHFPQAPKLSAVILTTPAPLATTDIFTVSSQFSLFQNNTQLKSYSMQLFTCLLSLPYVFRNHPFCMYQYKNASVVCSFLPVSSIALRVHPACSSSPLRKDPGLLAASDYHK